MNEKSTIKNLILTYGFLLGIGTIIVSVLKYTFGNYLEKTIIESVIGILLIIILIVYPIRIFKNSNNGYLKLSHALKIGLGVSLIAAILSAIYIYVFANFIETEFVNNLLAIEIDKLKDRGLNGSDAKKSIEMMQKFMMPMMITGVIIMNLFLGFLVSLFTGLILRKEDPNLIHE